MLRAGGNAIDAAAAIQFALNVAEPLASGIGGGAFSLIHLAGGETPSASSGNLSRQAQGRLFILDSRERAPAGATGDQFLGPNGRPIPWEEQCASGKAVGVPGTLMGLDVALGRWGRLPLARVLKPAIELAEGGLPVSAFMARRLEPQVAKLARDPASAAIFLPGGRPLQTGDRLVQPDLARTLNLIGEQGPDVFYRGEIGEALVGAARAGGGSMTLDDLAAYRVERREPLYGSYRGHEIATMPPPGAGVTLLQMLKLLEPFDLAALGRLTAARAHLELQAMRLALLDRAAHLGDPAYTPVPLQGLLDPDYLAARRALIERERLGPEPPPGLPAPLGGESGQMKLPLKQRESGQTTHLVALDQWGNLVCCTSTLEDFFGSGITVPGYGFLLNNELTDFDPRPGGANEIRPFARPASSMAPSLLLRDGKLWLALGSPGGPTIVTAILQTLLGLLDDGLSLEAAVAAPRYFAGQYPRFTWEKGRPAETLAGLTDLGHRPSQRPSAIGGVQAIMMDPESGRWFGVADPRREGAVIEVDRSVVSAPLLFRDRRDAGAQLAAHLGSYGGKDALVLGIPRGGALVAAEVARRLEADLDVVIARKLGAPNLPELAIGAVTASGGRWINERIIRERGVSDAYIEAVTAEQMAEARRRNERFRGGRRMSRVKGRVVIVVDDGLATGATVRAALGALRVKRPARLVVAAPVGSQRACTSLREEADEVVCPHELQPFLAVGRFYERFDQTEDAQVERVLQEAQASRRRRRGTQPTP